MSTEPGAIAKIWNWRITAFCALILLAVTIAAVSFGPISINFPCLTGIFVIPGSGQTLSVSYQ
jgi:hypothetical protein